MKIAFFGLGNMGAPMAMNLVKAGYEVTGIDPFAPCPAELRSSDNADEAAGQANIVITMLPNGGILRELAGQILPNMQQNSVLLDCSTVDIESARAVANQAEHLGVTALDAPVSGGVGGATAGTLTFMVGGDDIGFERVKPLFEVMGARAVYCGDNGTGQAAKICNNMILGVTMIATCEAFALADQLGLSRQAMFDVASTSSGSSWSLNTYCPAPGVGPESPADHNYQPGFASELMLKDLTLAQSAADGVNAETPMGTLAKELYQHFVDNENGRGRDFSAILQRFENKNNR